MVCIYSDVYVCREADVKENYSVYNTLTKGITVSTEKELMLRQLNKSIG